MPFALALAVLAAEVPPADADERAQYSLPCSYISKQELEPAEHCVADETDHAAVRLAILRDLSYTDGLATIAFGPGWHYRRRDGRMALMVSFDNGPDPFEQGVARARIDGHLAYVDRRLRVRIRTAFDQGTPFEHGRATVCAGCVEQRIDQGEHSILTGGRWGVIDRRGRIVVPVTLTTEPLRRSR